MSDTQTPAWPHWKREFLVPDLPPPPNKEWTENLEATLALKRFAATAPNRLYGVTINSEGEAI